MKMVGQARGVIKDGINQGPTDTNLRRGKSEAETGCCHWLGNRSDVERGCYEVLGFLMGWEKKILKLTG